LSTPSRYLPAWHDVDFEETLMRQGFNFIIRTHALLRLRFVVLLAASAGFPFARVQICSRSSIPPFDCLLVLFIGHNDSTLFARIAARFSLHGGDFFQVFGLERRFTIDLSALEHEFSC